MVSSKSIVHFVLALLLLTILCWLTFVGYKNYLGLSFSSDGFHCYSTLRNFSQGHGLWEGPTFQYLLGNHAYLTLILFTPFVAIFQSPMVLLIITILSHFVSVILIYRISYLIMNDWKISFILSALYFLLGQVQKSMFGGHYLFQPDFLIAPLILLIFLALLQQKNWLFWIASSLLIFTKEEYIFWFPILLVWMFILTKSISKDFKKKNIRFWVITIFVYFGCSIISLSTLLFFKSMNTFSYVSLESIFKSSLILPDLNLYSVLRFVWQNSYTLVILFVLSLVISGKEKSKWVSYVFLLSFSIILIRIGLNILIYNNLEGKVWPNTIFSPVILLGVLTMIMIVLQSELRLKWHKPIVSISCLFLILFNAYEDFDQEHSIFLEHAFKGNYGQNIEKSEIDQINVEMNKFTSTKESYFLASEFLMGPFMSRSCVVESFAIHAQEGFIGNADFILFEQNEKESFFYIHSNNTHKVVITTPHFILKRNNELQLE